MKDAVPMPLPEIISRSLRCLVFAILGFLPYIGLPAAFYSCAQYYRVKAGLGGRWNPAGRELFWGILVARLSLVAFLIELALLCTYIYLKTLAKNDPWD